MSIEKPITTTRKAVERMAEDRASKEFLETPESRHYESVFTTYKMLRMLDPQRLELVVKANAKEQDIKTEMGTDLFNIYQKVWSDVTKEGKNEIDKAVEQLKNTTDLSPKHLNEELIKLDERFLKEKSSQVKNDPRIVTAFLDKGELLNKSIELTTSSMLDLLKYTREAPKYF